MPTKDNERAENGNSFIHYTSLHTHYRPFLKSYPFLFWGRKISSERVLEVKTRPSDHVKQVVRRPLPSSEFKKNEPHRPLRSAQRPSRLVNVKRS